MNNKKELEKEKVIVEPYFYGETYYCPSCHKCLGGDHNNMEDVNFCSKCGQPLEWDNYEQDTIRRRYHEI